MSATLAGWMARGIWLGAAALVVFLAAASLRADPPDDPDYLAQWGSKAPFTILSIDSGWDLTHPDLANVVVPGWDYVDGDGDVSDPCYGHGTSTAGVIAARRNNGVGLAGVVPGARILGARVINCQGTADVDHIIAALRDLAPHVHAVHIGAFRSPAWPALPQAKLDEWCDAISETGKVVVGVAGNEGINLDLIARYPAECRMPNQLTVTGIDQTGALATFPGGQGASYGVLTVNAGAPGIDVCSTVQAVGNPVWTDPASLTRCDLWGSSYSPGYALEAVRRAIQEDPDGDALIHRDRALSMVRLGSLPVATSGYFQFDIAAVEAPPPPPPPPPDTGLAAHWPLDEGAGNTAVDVVGGHNGTLFGPGWVPGGIRCDGTDDYVEIPAEPFGFELWSELAISAWVANDVGIGSGTDDIISWWNYPASRGWIITHHRNDQYFAELASKGSVTGGIVSTARTHVAMTYSDAESELRFYVNGALVATTTGVSGTLQSSNAQIRICGQQDDHNFFDGVIEDVKIWNRTLSAQEIAALVGG